MILDKVKFELLRCLSEVQKQRDDGDLKVETNRRFVIVWHDPDQDDWYWHEGRSFSLNRIQLDNIREDILIIYAPNELRERRQDHFQRACHSELDM